MALKEIIIRLPEETLVTLDEFAAERSLRRDNVVEDLIEAYVQRERVRRAVRREADRKRQSPGWDEAFRFLDEFGERFGPMTEDDLDALIAEAVSAVRAQEAG